MKKYKVTMVCKEIWKAETIVECDDIDLEDIKDKAWADFDLIYEKNLEQENYTKVEPIQ